MALLQKQEKEEEKCKNTVMWVLAIIGAVAAVAGIAYAVYRFSHRIIWKTLKMISMMILTITLKMKITKKIKM